MAGKKPLLPAECQSRNFVHAAPAQVQEYATSAVVVPHLLESLATWISHCEQIITDSQKFFIAFDADTASVAAAKDELICEAAECVRRLELDTSFHIHFQTDEVKAVRRVLECVPATAANSNSNNEIKTQLQRLDVAVTELDSMNKKLARSKDLFQLLDSYCAPNSPWTLMNCDDTIPPLFGALRAIYICCALFGKDHPERFSALVRCILKRVEHLITSTVPPLLLPVAVATRHGVDDATAACLAAQAACVSIQEEFFKLRISIAEAVTKQHTAAIYTGIDEATVFSNVEFYYDRCVIILHLLSVIKQRRDEIFITEGPVEKLLSLALLSRGIAHEDIIDAIRSLADAPSMRPRDIVARIEAKSADYVAGLERRNAARIMEGPNYSAVMSGAGKRSDTQQQQQQQQHDSGAATNNKTTTGTSRVAELNNAANRDWSVSRGEQPKIVPRDAYFSVVVAFNPPKIIVTGIPLTHKQLEMISTRFQDALRSRVSHTAASIRSNRLDMASISTATSVLKAPYHKFRSAKEELADARYETQERAFHKTTRKEQETQSVEAELMQLRRYHVAASHNAYTLDMPDVSVDEDEIQSHSVNVLLETMEAIDGDDMEMATTNAFTDVDNVFYTFFVFRYLPSMPRSRQKRAD